MLRSPGNLYCPHQTGSVERSVVVDDRCWLAATRLSSKPSSPSCCWDSVTDPKKKILSINSLVSLKWFFVTCYYLLLICESNFPAPFPWDADSFLISIVSDVLSSWKPPLIAWVRLGASLWLPKGSWCPLLNNFAYLRLAEACLLHWTVGAWNKWPGGEWVRERVWKPWAG